MGAATGQPGPALSRLRIEHVNSSVKRGRIVKDRIRSESRVSVIS